MFAVTGATGQLGRLVIDALLESIAPGQVIAAVRQPGNAKDLVAKGVKVREANYDRPETLMAALQGVDRLLLISSNDIGRRGPQHQGVIDAAKAVGVRLVAYTSVLHADRSQLSLATEHRVTEAALAASGLPTVLLRNGWYTENHLAGLAAILQHNAVLGAAKEGRISSATRADYAAGAARVMTSDGHEGRTYELAGDSAWSLAELAAEIGRQTGRSIPYIDMPQDDYAAALKGAGLPGPFAELYADSDAGAAKGELFDDSRALSKLIGRPTTPLSAAVTAALGS